MPDARKEKYWTCLPEQKLFRMPSIWWLSVLQAFSYIAGAHLCQECTLSECQLSGGDAKIHKLYNIEDSNLQNTCSLFLVRWEQSWQEQS